MRTGTGDPYYDWLCMTIGVNKNIPGRNYAQLVSALHKAEFRPKMAMDSNRGTDGLQLRVDFISEHGAWGSATNRGPCSFLEFLIALAKRMSFLTQGEGNHGQTAFYFWQMIENLGLNKVTDDRWFAANGDFFVEDAVWRVNERQYQRDGKGGIFPLKDPKQDQRRVEIWYQMNAWLMENSNVGDW